MVPPPSGDLMSSLGLWRHQACILCIDTCRQTCTLLKYWEIHLKCVHSWGGCSWLAALDRVPQADWNVMSAVLLPSNRSHLSVMSGVLDYPIGVNLAWCLGSCCHPIGITLAWCLGSCHCPIGVTLDTCAPFLLVRLLKDWKWRNQNCPGNLQLREELVRALWNLEGQLVSWRMVYDLSVDLAEETGSQDFGCQGARVAGWLSGATLWPLCFSTLERRAGLVP